MNALRRLNAGLERTALAFVVAALGVMCVVVFAQVFGRYVVHYSLPWSEELSRFLMVWVSMLGSAVAARRRMHVGFDALVARLPAPARKVARAAAIVVAAAVFAATAWFGFRLASFNMAQTSAAMGIPMGYPYLAVPVGSLLLVLFLAEELLEVWTGREAAHAGAQLSGFASVE